MTNEDQTNSACRPYRVVLHEERGDKFKVLFDCNAKDADDAETQAEQEYPGSEIIMSFPFEDAFLTA